MTAADMFPRRPQFEAIHPDDVGSTQLYVFLSDWEYHSPKFGSGVVPAGFVTDFASIPAFFRRYMDDDDPGILYPSLRHDHRYTTKTIPREHADEEMAEGMKACGARWDQIIAAHRAVRMFGGSRWKE